MNDTLILKVPEKVKLVWFEKIYTIRKNLSPDLFKNSSKKDDFYKRIDNIHDEGIKNILKLRYEETKLIIEKHNETVTKADKKKLLEIAFSNLDENPIWLNKEKGIAIKRVTITGVSNARAIHYKKDHNGNFILDKNGEKQEVDFVSTGNNHHVAIYRDEKGNLQEEVISFFEAVELKNNNLPIINKSLNQDKGWEFLFSMKQNEYFIFPNEEIGFNPNEIDLLNPENTSLISPNLFRVQKFGNISTSGIWFRHHLETNVETIKELKEKAFIVIQSTKRLKGIIKVRINHLGRIVHIGEY